MKNFVPLQKIFKQKFYVEKYIFKFNAVLHLKSQQFPNTARQTNLNTQLRGLICLLC